VPDGSQLTVEPDTEASAAPELRNSTTTVTSTALPSKADPADREIAEAFMLATGREPGPGDGEAYAAFMRVIAANMTAAVTTPALPNEPADSVAWRQKTATRWLVTQKSAAKTIAAIAAPQTRSREGSSKRRRREQSSRSGDGGNPPRPRPPELSPPRRVFHRARGGPGR
jgi:hypothetical protein